MAGAANATPADQDAGESLAEQVRKAAREQTPLRIVGHDTKAFLGRPVNGDVLSTAPHCGIITYQPEELVLTARSGTPLTRIDQLLHESGQALPFDPPRFGSGGTLGGAIATGLSGPARPFLGAARDFVLGVRVVNGRGEVMRFGGEVMKNVAGYDISRLLTGSFGSLGVLLDVSVKVLAAPRTTRTIAFELPPRRAIELFASVRNRPLPLAGACHLGEHAWVRLAGSPAAVEQGTEVLMGEGGEALEETDDTQLWSALRDLRLDFFDDPRPLYRLSVPPARRPLDTPGECLIDWGGAQRWLLPAPGVELTRIRGEARALGGHATRFRPALSTTGATREQARISEVFQPLAPAVHAIHTRLKAAFDPHGILNPGRQYPGL